MSLNKSGIYRILNVVDNKCHIGSATNIKNRWYTHKSDLRKNKHHSQILQRAWNKHGERNFKFEVLLYCNKEDLIKNKQKQIDCINPVYNILKVAGSFLGKICSEETKLKIGLANKTKLLGTKQSQETILKRIESRKDYKHSEETKAKMSASAKNKPPVSEETRINMSIAQLNTKRTISPENRLKLNAALKGVSKKPRTQFIIIDSLPEAFKGDVDDK